jgi:nucleoporin NUP82
MPKVLSYTPEWLSRPSAGYKLFAPQASSGTQSTREDPRSRKTIETRGSEVFVAVGHEIRWADLARLKDDPETPYRTLRVSIPLPISRLTISTDGTYLAVSTSHTVHIVVLPDSALLDSDDTSAIKPKSFQVGPLAHVLEGSEIVSVLWHPLGYHGRCLVTITLEGVVRLWEINRADRSTFNEPAMSIDLKKLANATNDKEDLSASTFGAPKGFSPDSVELEVASACFGDFPEQEGVHGWAPLTLWIAMVEGDLYALCPLLPSKWQLDESAEASTFLQTLATSININYADIHNDADTKPNAKETADKQLSWLSDIIYQEPLIETLADGESIKVFTRPNSVPTIPLLQGPFSIQPDVDEFELSDIIVFSLKTFSDGIEGETAEGLPAAVVCFLTDTCKVHVCLDLEGIVGQWLPSSPKVCRMLSIVVYTYLTLARLKLQCWQNPTTPLSLWKPSLSQMTKPRLPAKASPLIQSPISPSSSPTLAACSTSRSSHGSESWRMSFLYLKAREPNSD